jgi:hypothetical protein
MTALPSTRIKNTNIFNETKITNIRQVCNLHLLKHISIIVTTMFRGCPKLQERDDLMFEKVQCLNSRVVLSTFFITLILLFTGALQKAICGEPVDFECEVFRLVNDERAIRGLPELAWNDLLFNAARGHSIDMATHNTLSHTGSNQSQPSERISVVGYDFRAYGENIAYNYADPTAVMAGWMESPGHRQNILNENFCELGVGLAYSISNASYWTQNFGRPVSDCPAPNSSNPCNDDRKKDSTATDDSTVSDKEENTSTSPDNAEFGESNSNGGGCFLKVMELLP